MPAGQGKDPKRYAAWEEPGSPLGPPAEDELEHEMALAAALDRNLSSLSPSADESARMHARMEAMLAGLAGGGPAGPPSGPRGPRAGAFPEALFAETSVPGTAFPERDTERTMRIEPVRDVAAPTARAAAAQPAAGAADPTAAAETTTAGTAPAETAPTGTDGAETVVARGDAVRSGGAAHAPGVARSRKARHVLPRGYRDRPDNVPGSRRPERPSGRRRITVVAAAALLVMIALTGGGMLASRDALPGDSLYGVKRAAESFGSVFTFGSDAKARRQLELASARLSEIEQLAARGGGDPVVLASAIDDFDSATTEGSRLVLDGAEGSGGAGMSDLSTWAGQASTRWSALRSSLPDPADADRSITLLHRIADRSAALQSRMNCSEVSDGSDDLGPIPATGACTPRSTGPSSGPTTGDRGTSQSARAGASTQPDNGSEDATASATPESATTTNGGVLPGLGTDGLPLPNPATGTGSGAGNSSPPTTTTSAPSQKGLLPPITLPPLLPGQSGITLGG
ncbi:DUF5667 domain-containing protein [Pseudonocardia dioxanivorans]|uniref:DUF5667 domain-containing protein n=1 Tax=Pseudonocardia dioxanivorans TaxID=240495 RepID=UPI000CCFFE33|nr:DUF5667 domain-containing protein [Pseudonocardia dioxanivorans]